MSLNYPSDSPEDKQFFDEKLNEIVGSLARQQAEKDLVKTITTDIKEAYGSEPAKVKKLAKYVYEQSVDGLLEEVEELIDVFSSINKTED